MSPPRATANLWFQLYVWRDREMTRSLVDRAWRAGYRVLEVSVDVPVAGMRTRDVRNGLTVPPKLTPRTLWSVAVKPGYWLALVRNPTITFANAPPSVARGAGRTIHNITLQFDPSVDLDDIAELRSALARDASRQGPDQPGYGGCRDRRRRGWSPSLQSRRPPARPDRPAA